MKKIKILNNIADNNGIILFEKDEEIEIVNDCYDQIYLFSNRYLPKNLKGKLFEELEVEDESENSEVDL